MGDLTVGQEMWWDIKMFSILRDPRLTSLRIYGIRDKAKLARVARATVKVIAAKKTT